MINIYMEPTPVYIDDCGILNGIPLYSIEVGYDMVVKRIVLLLEGIKLSTEPNNIIAYLNPITRNIHLQEKK